MIRGCSIIGYEEGEGGIIQFLILSYRGKGGVIDILFREGGEVKGHNYILFLLSGSTEVRGEFMIGKTFFM